MDMCVRVRRGLVVAGLLLGGVLLGFAPGAAFAAPAETRRDCGFDCRPGQPPRRSRHDPLVFQGGAGRAARCRQDRRRAEGALRLRPVRGRPHLPSRRPAGRDRGGSAGHRSARLRGQQQDQGRAAARRKSSRRRAARCRARRCRRTFSASSRSIIATGASTSRSCRRSSQRPNNRVDLIFEIKEGEKTGVKSIIFVGNKAYSSYRLKEVIKTSTSNFLSFLQTTDVYDPDRIEADRDLIRRFYLEPWLCRRAGRLRDRRVRPRAEGLHHHFHDRGRAAVPLRHDRHSIQHPRRRSAIAALRPAHETRATSITATRSRRRSRTSPSKSAKHGYPFATVRPRGDRNPQTRTIGVVFVVG